MTKSREGEVLQETMDTDSMTTHNSAHASKSETNIVIGSKQQWKEYFSILSIIVILKKKRTHVV